MPNPLEPEPSLITRFRTFFYSKILVKKKVQAITGNKLKASLVELIDEHTQEAGGIASDERELLGNVLDLRDLTAADVMVQRVDIVAISQDVSEQELINQFVKSRLQRLPVYRESLDDVLGSVNVQDVLAWKATGESLNLKSMIREVLYISPTMRTLDLLFQMREKGIHMAVVVDEFGGVDGLVTFSDLMEEIIGDIQDAREHEVPEHARRPDGSIVADGRVSLDLLEESYDLFLIIDDWEDEVETIGGLVSSVAGHVPARGEVITHPNNKVEFEIIDADPRRIKRLLIKML